MKITSYFYTTWSEDFKQLALIPSIFLTKSYDNSYNFGINFLCFDFGLWIIKRK